MLTRRATLTGALAMAALAIRGTFSAVAETASNRLVISDARGDYGLLAPYAHFTNGPGYLYTSYVFDTLLGQDRDGDLVPALARSWQISDDHLTYDITLNESARWHDGMPVTAADAEFTFQYMKDHPYVFGSVESVRAVEPISVNHVRLTLLAPDTSFPSNALLTLPILPKHIYEGRATPEQFVDMEAAIGSGPYRLVSYDKAQGRYLLERNQDYYLGEPVFDQVMIVRMTPDAAIRSLEMGEIDIISNLPFELVPRARAAGLNVLSTASNHPDRLVFNHRGLFANRTLRHALAYAIDRQALIDIVYPEAAVLADTGYFQEGSPWRSNAGSSEYNFDPERARDLLLEEGWTRDRDGQWHLNEEPITLRLVTDARYRRLATVLSEQLETFGLAIDLRVLELAALQQQVQSDRFDLMLRATSTIGDPGGIARRVLGNSWSSDRYPDPSGTISALLDAQRTATDPEERRDLLHRFEVLYAEELPSYMLVNALWATAHSNRVSPLYLPDGVASGIPMALHKSMFFQ